MLPEEYRDLARIIGGAADTLEHGKWGQGANISRNGICMSQALLVHIGTRKRRTVRNQMLFWSTCLIFPEKHQGWHLDWELPAMERAIWRPHEIMNFNDSQGRSKQEVLDKLRLGEKEALRRATDVEFFPDEYKRKKE